ncbi:hypothetical protein L484_025743 [Morus notabilis]|uniref:Uncharacterized protein n=1 Tax=Morus notabilis TaxID=981085 RepID=W9R3Z9_9ROSA|nr:hypothetical protein L484_025743 [Morus notabilis]
MRRKWKRREQKRVRREAMRSSKGIGNGRSDFRSSSSSALISSSVKIFSVFLSSPRRSKQGSPAPFTGLSLRSPVDLSVGGSELVWFLLRPIDLSVAGLLSPPPTARLSSSDQEFLIFVEKWLSIVEGSVCRYPISSSDCPSLDHEETQHCRWITKTASGRRPNIALQCRLLIFVEDSSPFHSEALYMTSKLDRRHGALVEVQACGSMVTEEQPHAMLIPLEYFLMGYDLYRPTQSNVSPRSPLSPLCIAQELFLPESMGLKLKPIKTRISLQA